MPAGFLLTKTFCSNFTVSAGFFDVSAYIKITVSHTVSTHPLLYPTSVIYDVSSPQGSAWSLHNVPTSLVCNFIQKGVMKECLFIFIPVLIENVREGVLGFSLWQKSCTNLLCCGARGLGGSYSGLWFFFCGLSATTPLVHLHPRQVDLEHDQDRCPSGTNLPFILIFSHPSMTLFLTPSLATLRASSQTEEEQWELFTLLPSVLKGEIPHYLRGWLEEEQLGTAGGGTAGHSWWAAFWDIPGSSPVTPHFSPAVLPLLYFYFIAERMKLLKFFYFFELSFPNLTPIISKLKHFWCLFLGKWSWETLVKRFGLGNIQPASYGKALSTSSLLLLP